MKEAEVILASSGFLIEFDGVLRRAGHWTESYEQRTAGNDRGRGGAIFYEPGSTKGFQLLEEAGDGPGTVSLRGLGRKPLWLCLDLGLPASRTVRKLMPVV